MLTKKKNELYDAFYESTHRNEFLDEKTELLVGLSAALSLNCSVHSLLSDESQICGSGEGRGVRGPGQGDGRRGRSKTPTN